MINFTNTIHINRPVDEVYAYLVDLEHTPEWNWAITETKKTTAGPVAVGTRYQQTRSVPRPATEHLEINALEPNRRIEVDGTLAQFPAHLSYQVEKSDNGTELTNTVELQPEGALRLVGSLIGGRIRRAVADNLNQLKTLSKPVRIRLANDTTRPRSTEATSWATEATCESGAGTENKPPCH